MPRNSEMLSQPAYDYLRELIMSKQLTPGARVSEAAIAQNLGISRTPVRDALRLLASDGLIEIFPNRFAQVIEYSPKQIQEIGLMRLNLDQLAVRSALIYGSKADFFALQKTAEKCQESFRLGLFLESQRLDCDFHLQLSEISCNQTLLHFQKQLYLKVMFILVHYPRIWEKDDLHMQQHFLIADAMIAQDKELALSLLREHMVEFYRLDELYLNELL